MNKSILNSRDLEHPLDDVYYIAPRYSKIPSASHFTLLEVVVAVAILAMGLVAAMEIAVTASKRTIKAAKRWETQHMLSQATEYFLLAGHEVPIPNEFFPFEGFRAECLEEPPDLSDDVEPLSGNWRLVKLRITIYDSFGKEVGSLSIHKILYSAPN